MNTLTQLNKKNPFVGSISNQPREIVILDPKIPDSNYIAIGIKPNTKTYILKNQPDAVEQITKILAKHTDIEALHIITHGSPGTLYLGKTELNNSNIENYSQQLQQWQNSFNFNASIILYGCNVAAEKSGHQFLTQLNQLTGANIAANSQPTGNSELGGTWDITQLIPPSPQAPKLALTETTLKTYGGVLGLAPKVDFTTGNGPTSVSIGDINGDGKPDLAVANQIGNVSILLNTTLTGAATPTFAPQALFGTGIGPFSVSISDINSDGLPDLAVSNVNDNNVSILLNTTTGAGSLTFTPQVTFPTGSVPISVSIGDFNGDGKPDLAVSNYNGNNVSILLNTTTTGATTPTFAPQVTFPTNPIPYFISIGDINSDGKPDLAVANLGDDNNVSILLNNTAKVTTVTATTADGTYGIGSTIAITVTFDQNVTVIGTPQLQLETGTVDRLANYASGSGTTALTFNYVVQPGDTSGDLEYLATNALTLNGGTIKDNLTVDAILTLPALASAQSLGGSKAIVIDTLAPNVTLTSTSPPTVTGLFNVTATFNEDVFEFDNTDLTVGNATVSNFVKVDAKTYTFDVTPTANGNVTVDVPTAKATDTAGNNNTAANQLLRTANITPPPVTPPTVALTSTSPPTVTGLFSVTATFNEDVIGFDNTDLTVANATVGNFVKVDAKTYTFNVTPTADGNVTVDIPAAKATDTAGNNNTAATQLTRIADITAPNVTLTSTSPPTVTGLFSVTATFNEDVIGFDNTDLTVANATAGNFFKVDAKTYTFNVTPIATGNVTVDIPAAKATDTAGNNNTPANQLIRTANVTIPPVVDVTPPNVALTSTSPQTVTGLFSVTATFNEDVIGFDNTEQPKDSENLPNFLMMRSHNF
jgi:large repetitive protein